MDNDLWKVWFGVLVRTIGNLHLLRPVLFTRKKLGLFLMYQQKISVPRSCFTNLVITACSATNFCRNCGSANQMQWFQYSSYQLLGIALWLVINNSFRKQSSLTLHTKHDRILQPLHTCHYSISQRAIFASIAPQSEALLPHSSLNLR